MKDKIIEKLCEVASHLGSFESKPTVNGIIKALEKAKCPKCDKLAKELSILVNIKKE
jgi:hypothetical protein